MMPDSAWVRSEGSSEEGTLRLDLEGSVGASQAKKQEAP